jgi:23S rRNA (adenine1618-N6)-methyltransferase
VNNASGPAAPVPSDRLSGDGGKSGLHPRNRHRGRYDFTLLCAASPGLARFVSLNRYGDRSIDFADPAAVKALNAALLRHFYKVGEWDIPTGYLCPPIPGRADYLHHLADLLARDNGGVVPRGESVRLIDIGVGASCIYPLIGHAEYGWRFLGADIDPQALASAQRIVDANGLAETIELRRQGKPQDVFQGLLRAGELFAATLCNPPFHASPDAAHEGSSRKWRGLGKGRGRVHSRGAPPTLNFGGQGAELWCPGGEAAFVRRMVAESAQVATRCCWFSSLISKEASLPAVYGALKQAGALACETIEMAQGQKKSRLVAWSFLDQVQRTAWLGRYSVPRTDEHAARCAAGASSRPPRG